MLHDRADQVGRGRHRVERLRLADHREICGAAFAGAASAEPVASDIAAAAARATNAKPERMVAVTRRERVLQVRVRNMTSSLRNGSL